MASFVFVFVFVFAFVILLLGIWPYGILLFLYAQF